MNSNQRILKLKLLSLNAQIDYALKMLSENNVKQAEKILSEMKKMLSEKKTKGFLRDNDDFGKMEEGVE